MKDASVVVAKEGASSGYCSMSDQGAVATESIVTLYAAASMHPCFQVDKMLSNQRRNCIECKVSVPNCVWTSLKMAAIC